MTSNRVTDIKALENTINSKHATKQDKKRAMRTIDAIKRGELRSPTSERPWGRYKAVSYA
jgi:predicted RNA-binding protein associated with RNAse of E/G family